MSISTDISTIRTDFEPALMIPTEWACLCPVCGHETPLVSVTANGDPALRNAVYRSDDADLGCGATGATPVSRSCPPSSPTRRRGG